MDKDVEDVHSCNEALQERITSLERSLTKAQALKESLSTRVGELSAQLEGEHYSPHVQPHSCLPSLSLLLLKTLARTWLTGRQSYRTPASSVAPSWSSSCRRRGQPTRPSSWSWLKPGTRRRPSSSSSERRWVRRVP